MSNNEDKFKQALSRLKGHILIIDALVDLRSSLRDTRSFAIVLGGEKDLVAVSSGFTDTLGYTPEEVAGMPYIELVHPDDKARTIAFARSGVKDGSFINRYRKKDGNYTKIEWMARPIHEMDGLALYLAIPLEAP